MNGGRLRLYAQDGSAEYQETLRQLELARAIYRPNRTMTFHVDPSDGHDDLLMSLALLAVAVKDLVPRVARGADRPEGAYEQSKLWTPRRVAVQQPLFPL